MAQLRRRDIVGLLLLVVSAWALLDLLAEKELELEYARFELRLSELKTTALVKDAELVASRKQEKAVSLEGGNPFSWMQIVPHEYVGEAAVGSEDIPPGSWIYDPKKKMVAYRANRIWFYIQGDSILDTGVQESQWLQFRVVRLRSKDNSEKVVNHLAVVGLQKYRWKQQESEANNET